MNIRKISKSFVRAYKLSWRGNMKITESRLRKLIRDILLEEKKQMGYEFDEDRSYTWEEEDIKTHAFHGWGMKHDSMKYQASKVKSPQFVSDGEKPVSQGEVNHAVNYLNKHEPEHLVVYSRGSAVWAAAQDAAGKGDLPPLPSSLKKITYLAPAAKRQDWGQQDNSLDPVGNDMVVASSADGRVPVKHSAQVAQETGKQMYLYKPKRLPKELTDANASIYGLKGHQQPMYHKGQGKVVTGADLDKIIDTFPDWDEEDGPGSKADKTELQTQMDLSDEILESRIRSTIRSILLEKKKKGKKKRKVKCPLLPNGKRDYKCEYQKYGGASKKGKKDRAARNKARKHAEKMGLVRKGDGMELDHIMPLSLGGSNDQTNWQIMSRTDNRRKGKKWDGKSGSKK